MGLNTFEKQFRISQASQSSTGAMPFVVDSGREYSNENMRLASKQIEHYRLWNYVAISRNAMKASESFPNVSRMRRARSTEGRETDYLTKRQRQHLNHFYRGTIRCSHDELAPVPDSHPLVDLFYRINGVDWWQSFAYESYVMYQLTGVCYWWVINNVFGTPAELWVLPTQWVKERYNRQRVQVGWDVVPDGDMSRKIELELDEVVYNKMKSPHGKMDPLSPVDAGAPWILSNESIEDSRKKAFDSGLLQRLALEFDPELYPEDPGDELLSRIGRKFMDRYAGVHNADTLPTIPPGTTLKEIGHTPKDMDFPNGSDQSRDAILALHGTPKMAAGLSHDLNKASIFGADYAWCQNTINPILAMFAGFMTERIARRYGDDLVVWFDDCRPHDEEKESQDRKDAFDMGAMTPEQVAESMDLPLPEGNAAKKTFIKSGLVPLEDYNESFETREPETPPSSGDDDEGDDDDDDDDDDGPDSDNTSDSNSGRTHTARRNGSDRHDDGFDKLDCVSYGASVSTCEACAGTPHTDANTRERRISRRFRRFHKRYERAAERSVKRFWIGLRKDFVKQAKRVERPKDIDINRILPTSKFQDLFNRTMRKHWSAGMRGGIAFEIATTGVEPETDATVSDDHDQLPDIDVKIPPALVDRIEEFVKTKERGVWSLVDSTMRKDLESAISEGVQAEEGLDAVVERIEEVFGDREVDAVTIARTESTGALNSGQQALRENVGITRKEWISTRDDHTRLTHEISDDQIVDNDKPFKLGAHGEYLLMFPGDTSLGAPAKEIVNCRCTSAGVVTE